MEPLSIAGVACTTPLGNSPEKLFDALLNLKNNSEIYSSNGIDRSFALLENSFSQLFLKMDIDSFRKEEVLLYLSSSKGGLESFSRTATWSHDITPSDRAALHIKRKFGFEGSVICVTAACATGIYALDSAMRSMVLDNTERAIVATTESALVPAVLAGFRNMGVISSGIPKLCALKRDGFLPAEGAAVIAIERQVKKGSVIVRSTSCTTFPEHPISLNENGNAIADCIAKCIKKGGIEFSEVGAVCIHGTATMNNDLSESRGIKKAFGDYHVPCFGVKPLLGHLLGSSALVEIVICYEALRKNIIPPTLLVGERDPLCDINLSAVARELREPNILSLNFGFGGHIGAVLLGRAD
jgi:3-oxoacyl-[acyl-carrier-protein] synthase II